MRQDREAEFRYEVTRLYQHYWPLWQPLGWTVRERDGPEPGPVERGVCVCVCRSFRALSCPERTHLLIITE